MPAVAQLNTEGVFALKNVRLIYKKSGPLRFVSHLDMNRFMTRLIRLSRVPVWYTEGFNKHPYITFALPLSLGFESEYEVMDFRLQNDDFPLEKAKEMIGAVAPVGLTVTDLIEPTFKSGKIAFADFEITFSKDSAATVAELEAFLDGSPIIITKKTKKGALKELDITEKVNCLSVLEKEGRALLNLRLPAGGSENINPKAVVDLFLEKIGDTEGFYTVNRKMLYTENGEVFR